ncbi:universal stress protein [Pengzhenrongella frigida]|uniref:Universal stress protein n=1 Tax=Pengzhenrongella frigida TaxID=1259133 RepID=A0A4Q5N2M4_9MICO|nr:universal stress protein [Cellulomonas sp. HLT2-17]RYV50331.1 universal stress protein [Cellulomonas sp. HLT2-17]
MSIVVGYLATPEGRTALEAATVEAQNRSTHLVVVTSHQGNGRDERVRLDEERELDEVSVGLELRGVSHEIRLVARSKDVADDLIAAAQENDGSLIVIGLRRRSPVGKLILGVNAQRILLGAPCPVLAVKPALAVKSPEE